MCKVSSYKNFGDGFIISNVILNKESVFEIEDVLNDLKKLDVYKERKYTEDDVQKYIEKLLLAGTVRKKCGRYEVRGIRSLYAY